MKILFLMLTLGLSQSLLASTGEKIFLKSCAGCHESVVAMPGVPILHGQEPGYIQLALKAYKDNTRQDTTLNTMNAIAKSLSDRDMEEVASYLAGQDPCKIRMYIDPKAPGFIEAFKAGRKIVKTKNCMHCHNSFHHSAPRLLGQKKDYLEKSLNEFKDGTRVNPMMNRFAAEMNAEEIENITTYLNGMRLMRECPQ